MATVSDAFAAAVKHHKAGRLVHAEFAYQQILSVDPSHSDAIHLLGVIAFQTGRYLDAVNAINRSIRLNGNVAHVHNNLGDVYLALRKVPEAIACYRRALELSADYVVAHVNLGNALIEQGSAETAIVSYCRAIELQPDMVEAYCLLANALLRGGWLPEADACCRKALELKPDYAEAHDQLGQVSQQMGNFDAALGWYRRGLQLAPQSAFIHFNTARLFQETEQYAQAMAHYQRATQLAPEFAHAHYGQGMILYERGDLDLALEHYREAIRLRPDFALAHCGAGLVYRDRGELDQAANSFREAVGHDPDCSEAYSHLANLLRGDLAEIDLLAIRLLATKPNLTQVNRSGLHFGLAVVEDARRDFSNAAKDLCLANSLSLADRDRRGIVYRPGEHDRFVAQMIEIFTPKYFERVRGFGLNSEQPIFIVGLPRSGTTLTEQILASHSKVYGAGEVGLGWSAFIGLPNAVSRHLPSPECLPYLDAELTKQIAKNCLDRIALFDGAALRFTDKLPDNYLYAGLLATLFPRAKIIHCRRDLRDIAVSCWMSNFRQVHWANCLEHIASRFKAYERLMEHWYQTLPIPILNVDYEETVYDVERTAKRLVDFCGLEWEPACVVFHENRRPVRTASSTEIRQPIYQKSVGRWKHYESALKPLFSMLNDCDFAREDSVIRNRPERGLAG